MYTVIMLITALNDFPEKVIKPLSNIPLAVQLISYMASHTFHFEVHASHNMMLVWPGSEREAQVR